MMKYIGNGFLIGIPARDLTDDEVIKHGGEKFLLSTGLYAKVKKEPDKEPVKEASDGGS